MITRLDEQRGFAAHKLLTLYNEDWCDDQVGEVDRAAIHLYDEPDVAAIYFADGGLFEGDAMPTRAGIIG